MEILRNKRCKIWTFQCESFELDPDSRRLRPLNVAISFEKLIINTLLLKEISMILTVAILHLFVQRRVLTLPSLRYRSESFDYPIFVSLLSVTFHHYQIWNMTLCKTHKEITFYHQKKDFISTYWHSSSVCLLESVQKKNFPLNNWTAMTANINWNSIYTMRILITFFSEFTTQSNTALSFGTRLIVFSGRKTRSTRNDLIVDKLLVTSLPASPLKNKWNEKWK